MPVPFARASKQYVPQHAHTEASNSYIYYCPPSYLSKVTHEHLYPLQVVDLPLPVVDGEPLFRTPSGEVLKFKWFTRRDVWNTDSSPEFWERARSTKKRQRPMLNFEVRGVSGVVVADFDSLPDGYATWEGLRSQLRDLFSDKAIVTSSSSNKAKVFFAVAVPKPLKLSQTLAERFLREVIPHSLFSAVDVKGSGWKTTFLTEDMAMALHQRLPGLAPLPVAVIPEDLQQIRGQAPKTFERYKGDIPPGLRSWARTEKQRDFSLILAASVKLASEKGAQLSTRRLASEVGVSVPTISSWISELVRTKILVCIDSNAILGKRCRIYKANGRLLQLLRATKSTGRKLLPKSLPEGDSHDQILAIVRHYNSLDKCLEYARALPGHKRKHDGEIRSAHRGWQKKLALRGGT